MKMIYPPARIEASTDCLAGISFPDPYQWLEDDSEDTRAWQRAQTRLAEDHVRAMPLFDEITRLVRQFNIERRVELPRFAGGWWFRIEKSGEPGSQHVLVSRDPLGPGRAIAIGSGPTSVLSWLSPSPDGQILAVGRCLDGSERNAILLLDVESGDELPGPPSEIMLDNWTGGVHWLPDSRSFYFNAIPSGEAEFEQVIFLHRRLPHPETARVNIPWTKPGSYRMVLVARDGRHAVAMEGVTGTIPAAIARLGTGNPAWKPFVSKIDGSVAGYAIGDMFIAVTDVGAPRGRIVAIPLQGSKPNDPNTWRELVPESEAVLRSLVQVGEALYVTELIDTYARVRIVSLSGSTLGTVPLPASGVVGEWMNVLSNLLPKGHPDQFLFAFSSLTESWGIYRHVQGDSKTEVIVPPRVRLDNAVVEDGWAVSSDGTRVPYHVVYRDDLVRSGPQPTLIFGYGGQGGSLLPQFPGAMAAFVELGGVFVHAHLRGGLELGSDWWRSARYCRKQNCYEDLYAIAETLIGAGRTSTELLGVTGASHGGLMAATAATQRPDLWAVAVPRVPRTDLVAACRTPYGRMSIAFEHGDPDDPAVARWLATLSPYHLIEDGVRYPAVFIDAGALDPRTPASHVRKFVARLQHATSSDRPVLLHIWDDIGHGGASEAPTIEKIHAEWLTFVVEQLRLTERSSGRSG